MHTWDISNHCPDEIIVYYRSLPYVTIPAGEVYSTEMPGSPGVIFTNYNNGTFDMTRSMRFTTWSDDDEETNVSSLTEALLILIGHTEHLLLPCQRRCIQRWL